MDSLAGVGRRVMREDMFKVIVERPRLRLGRHEGSRYRRGAVKSMFRDLETAPKTQRMGFPRKDKLLSENLAPLQRFLHKRVGRRWDDVYSEIAQRIDRKSPVQAHIYQHLDDFVARHVLLFEGVPYQMWFGRVRPLRADLYVCPLSGVLERYQGKPKARPPERFVPIDAWSELRQVNGRWHHVTLAKIPAPDDARRRCFDVLLGEALDPRWFSPNGNLFLRRFGREDRYAVATRAPGKREMRLIPGFRPSRV